MKKRSLDYHNAPSSGEPLAADASPKDVKKEFARRIQKAMTDKGWNQAELARMASKYTVDKKEVGRFSISNYVRGHSIPRPDQLIALAQALGVKPGDLLPTRGVPGVDPPPPPSDLKDLGHGRVWLRVNQETSWDTALKILSMLKVENK